MIAAVFMTAIFYACRNILATSIRLHRQQWI